MANIAQGWLVGQGKGDSVGYLWETILAVMSGVPGKTVPTTERIRKNLTEALCAVDNDEKLSDQIGGLIEEFAKCLADIICLLSRSSPSMVQSFCNFDHAANSSLYI